MAKSKLKEKAKETFDYVKEKLSRKPKSKVAIYENSLEKIGEDFVVRITSDRITIKDEVTLLKLTPKIMGEVVIEKLGERIIVSIEQEKRI